jgi:hypothetical protein
MGPCAGAWEGINLIMAGMPMLTGKAKRWRTTEPEGKVAGLPLANGCQACGYGQAYGRWSTARCSLGTCESVTPQEPSES